MDTVNYKPNSHKYKEEQKAAQPVEKKVEKVVTSPVKMKKGGVRKLKDGIISEDAHNVKSYLLQDVIIPAIKNTIEDVVIKGIRIALRGEAGARDKRSPVEYVSYNKIGDRGYTRPVQESRPRLATSYADIGIQSRGDAEAVIRAMRDQLETYGIVSVADLCEMVGVRSEYTDHKYGWTNLDSARVVYARGEYKLDLPRAIPLN